MVKNTVTVNTGTRIAVCEVYNHNGRLLIKALKDIGAAFKPMSNPKQVFFSGSRNANWYDLGNAKGLTARTGEAALTALDENGRKREGYRG